MTTAQNPFHASFGTSPPLPVGRDGVIADFRLGLEKGPGAHERISLLVDVGGIGKTALLNELEDTAKDTGWLTISKTATEGFVDKLKGQLTDFLDRDRTTRTSFQVGPSALRLKHEYEQPARKSRPLRALLTEVLDTLANHKRFNCSASGVLIKIDELHFLHHDEIVEFATAIQHLVRENRDLAVVMAGVPSSVRPLLAS